MSHHYVLVLVGGSYLGLSNGNRPRGVGCEDNSFGVDTEDQEKVEMFDSFTEDNDPHGERDFGAFEHEGQRIFWKIDYYDRSLTYGSENPADPQQTVRVLTIMLASEY